MPDKLTTRMSPPSTVLLKNTAVSDFLSLLTACFLVKSTVPHVQLIKVWPPYDLSCVAVMSHTVILPPQGRHRNSCQAIQQEEVTTPWCGKSHFLHPLQTSLFTQICLVSPSYKSSQAQPAPGASSEDLPFLCAASLVLEHNLNKICLQISLEFPLNFYPREPKNPNTNNEVTCLYSIYLTKLDMQIFYLKIPSVFLKIPSVFQPSLSSFISYQKTNWLH